MLLPPADTCLMFLIRHGATASNVARPAKLQGRGVNLGLSDEGRIQAAKTANLLSTLPISAVFSSPLKRAWETAERIAEQRELAVQVVDDLCEVDVGKWEGRSWGEIAESEPEAYRLFQADPGLHGYVGGENMQQVQDRVTPALERTLRAQLGRIIAVVGHNVVNRAYLARVLGLPIARSRNLIQDNCGVNLLRYTEGATTLVTCNTTLHLEG